jgi:hypothetical protein
MQWVWNVKRMVLWSWLCSIFEIKTWMSRIGL